MSAWCVAWMDMSARMCTPQLFANMKFHEEICEYIRMSSKHMYVFMYPYASAKFTLNYTYTVFYIKDIYVFMYVYPTCDLPYMTKLLRQKSFVVFLINM